MKKILFTIIASFLSFYGISQNYVPGYARTIKGDDFQYHSAQPDAQTSMLIRSQDAGEYIEWETAPVPDKIHDERITFLMLADIDVNAADPHSWDIFVNGKKYFTISSPTDPGKEGIKWMGLNASKLEFVTSSVDRHGDLTGYLLLSLNPKLLSPGEPVKIKVKPVESAGSQTWFMVFKYVTANRVTVTSEPAIRKNPDGETQVLEVIATYFNPAAEAVFTIGKETFTKQLEFGYNVHYLEIPEVKRKTNLPVKVTVGETILTDEKITLMPVNEMTIFLLPHSHVDIGYTDLQENVEKQQWKNLEQAIALAESTQDYPYGSRFRWNTEITWAVDSYLKKADKKKKQKLLQAIKKRWIEVDGIYANMLTGLCTPEELFHLFDAGKEIAEQTGIPLRAAMITDIPGWSWGLVAPMAQSGIRYLSLGTNRSDRIGNIIKAMGDKPFYWVSPSGEEKVFTWVHQEGYSYFHTGQGAKEQQNLLTEKKIFSYLKRLYNSGYAYDMTTLRYNIVTDNGPPDEHLCDAVKAWNEKYVTPKLYISTVSEALGMMEKLYRDAFPEYRGDITGYWEDGAASTAFETALNRQNAIRLSQTEFLFAMNMPQSYPGKGMEETWKNIMLYDEHTWGAWNSVSEPEDPSVIKQWETKRNFAYDAKQQIDELQTLAFKVNRAFDSKSEILEVINTNSWTRSGWVDFYPSGEFTEYAVLDPSNEKCPVHIAEKNAVRFYVKDIPPFSSKIFRLKTAGGPSDFQHPEPSYTIENKFFTLTINKKNGSIEELIWKKTGQNLVDKTAGPGINQYLYVEGRLPEHPETATVTNIMSTDKTSIVIEMKAPGCKWLRTRIWLDDFAPQIHFENTLNKTEVYFPESVRFAFPFNISKATVRYDLALADCKLPEDQLPGANKNFITIENLVDISNDDLGITWVSNDAPLVEIGQMMNDARAFGYVNQPEPSPTLYSWVMNNYWETNFKAAQEGYASFRYTISVHEKYNAAEVEKTGLEQRIPLIVTPASTDTQPKSLGIKNDNPDIVFFAVRMHNDTLLVSLQNVADSPRTFDPKTLSSGVFTADFWGNTGKPVENTITIPPKGIRHFLVYREKNALPKH
jgi:hypothetical protein